MKRIESITISKYDSIASLSDIGIIPEIEIKEITTIIASTGEANPYIKGIAVDATNTEFHAICFLSDASESKLKDLIKKDYTFDGNLTLINAEPFDYVKGVGVTFNNCVLPEISA